MIRGAVTRRVGLLAALALALILAGCAPRLQEIGPPIRQPAITEHALAMPDGVDLPLLSWAPWESEARAAIIALHGFNDHSGGMEMPGHGLARRGFIVYAYDQRGFGRAPLRGIWPGARQLTADLRIAIELVRARHPDLKLYVLGESMGASVIMAALAEPEALPVDGAILAAPAIWGRQTIGAFDQRILDGAAHLVPWIKVRPTGVRRVASDNRAALRRLAADPLVIRATRIDAAHGLVELMTEAYAAATNLGEKPTLLLFGKQEGILDKGAVAQFLATLKPGETRLALYARGYHLLLRDFGQARVLDDISHWIADPKAALPSGADDATH